MVEMLMSEKGQTSNATGPDEEKQIVSAHFSCRNKL